MEILRFLIGAVAGLLAAGALIASLGAQGGRFSARLDVLTHFAPLYLVAALAALALAFFAARPMRAPAAFTALVATGAVAALMAPEFLSGRRDARASADAPDQLKIVQFNAWGGNRKAAAAADWIVAQNPDVIVMEEGGRLRDLLTAKGFHPSCQACSTVVMARRAPVRTASEPRADDRPAYLVSATYADGRGEFTVVGVHRYWPTRFALGAAQTANLRALIDTAKARLILAGDFNSTPWSFARRAEDRDFGMIRRTRAMFSWPAARLSHNRLPALFPYLPIDHVYAGPGWATVSVERGPELGSDHYPVVVTLAPIPVEGSAVHPR